MYSSSLTSVAYTAERVPPSPIQPHGRRYPAVRLVDGEDLSLFLVRQPEQFLYLVELVHVFPLVKQNLAVAVVNDGLFHNGRGDDIVHFLGDHYRFPKVFPDGLEQISYIFTHVRRHQGLPAFLDQYHFPDAFQLAHLADEGFMMISVTTGSSTLFEEMLSSSKTMNRLFVRSSF